MLANAAARHATPRRTALRAATVAGAMASAGFGGVISGSVMFANIGARHRKRARPGRRLETATVTAAAVGYLVGSIPIANAVARRHGVDDLREVGDRNPGYWNARETLGERAAMPVFAGDVAKGAVGALLGRLVFRWAVGPEAGYTGAVVGGGSAMVGHSFPLFAGLRGGRSVLTFVGTAAVAAPASGTAATTLTAAAWAATGRFDRAARLGVAAFPLLQLVIDGPRRTAASGALMTFVGARFVSMRTTSR